MSGYKSTALSPLHWPLLALLSGTLAAYSMTAPTWLIIGLFCSTLLLVATYVRAYFYFMDKNPDALRSERYSIQKLEIEKRLIGDDLTGYTEDGLPKLPTVAESAKPDQKQ